MSQYPRRVLNSIYLIWDSAGRRLPLFVRAGTVVDIVPGQQIGSRLRRLLEPVRRHPGERPEAGRELGAQTFTKSALSN